MSCFNKTPPAPAALFLRSLLAAIALATCMTACAEPKMLKGTLWRLVEVDAGGADQTLTQIPRVSQLGTLLFDPDGSRLTGTVGCQALNATYEYAGDGLRIKHIELSGSRCHNQRSDKRADQFAQALKGVSSLHLDGSNGRLELLSEGRVVAVLRFLEREEYRFETHVYPQGQLERGP